MLNILVAIDKQCVTCKGQVVTFKGHCKVKGQVLDHMLVTPLCEAIDESNTMV